MQSCVGGLLDDYSIFSSARRDIVSYEIGVVLQDVNLSNLRAPNTPLNIFSPKDFNAKTFSIDNTSNLK